MDRHVKWLRRRIVASIATQTAETFAVVAVVAFAIMQWRTDEGPLTALFGSVVIAQLVALARVGHAMRNNPLNYVFMRAYVDRPFNYKVARFQGDEEAHPVAQRLPGFAPVATIRDADADPEPIFDVYHDPSRLVAASISRASGAVALISSLADGRILVTDARAMPPHERLVMNLAEDDSLESVIGAHQAAISARNDVAELASSAHQVVLDSLGVEHDAYVSLGPALSPFLDLEPQGRGWLRLSARITPAELAKLPVRLGPDMALPKVRVPNPEPAPVVAAPLVQAPMVEAALVESPMVQAPMVEAALVESPMVQAPMVEAALVEAPVVQAPLVESPVVHSPVVAASPVESPVVHSPVVAASPVAESPVGAPVPVTNEVAEAPARNARVVETSPVFAPAVHAVSPADGVTHAPLIVRTHISEPAPVAFTESVPVAEPAPVAVTESVPVAEPAPVAVTESAAPAPTHELAFAKSAAPAPTHELAVTESAAPAPTHELAVTKSAAPAPTHEPAVVEPVSAAPVFELPAFVGTSEPRAHVAAFDLPDFVGTATNRVIAPSQFVTVEPESDDFEDSPAPITAEVPVVVAELAPTAPVVPTAAPLVPAAPVVPTAAPLAPVVPTAAPAAPLAPAVPTAAPLAPLAPAAAPLAPAAPVVPTAAPLAPAALAPAALTPPTIEQSIPIDVPVTAQEVLAPLPVALPEMPPVPAAAAQFAPLPQFSVKPPAPPATLAEAVVPAPDSPAALTQGVPTPPPADERLMHDPATDLAAALGFSDVTQRSRPRLSAALKAHPAAAPAPAPKRSRRKNR